MGNKMHVSHLLAILMLAIVQVACADSTFGNIRISNDQKISNPTVINILNNSEVVNINKNKISDSYNLVLKLYKIPISGDCVAETHAICAYDYYLAVSEYDEQPRQTVYHLGVVGEISKIDWRESTNEDEETLQIRITNYPVTVIKQSPKLDIKSKDYLLRISTELIEVVDI